VWCVCLCEVCMPPAYADSRPSSAFGAFSHADERPRILYWLSRFAEGVHGKNIAVFALRPPLSLTQLQTNSQDSIAEVPSRRAIVVGADRRQNSGGQKYVGKDNQ
jgi:hypothetical protein